MSKHNIPIKMGEHSVIDSEFSSIRERFDAEMRKMEDEMNKFRSELISRESCGMPQSSLTSSTRTQQQTQQTQQQQTQQNSAAPAGQLATIPSAANWIDSLNSPLVEDVGDQKQLKLRFDVSQYAPEEIVVKTVDNKLLVHAKHEEKSDSRSVYREYNREFLLPQGCNPELIKSSLSKDKVLTVCAPLPAALAGGESRIPIAQQ